MNQGISGHSEKRADGSSKEESASRLKRLFEYIEGQNLILTPSTRNEIEHFVDLLDEVSHDHVLIVGDTGVGKSLFLKAFRFLYEEKNGKEQITEINCSHLNPELSASRLFGHVKGAFTGAVSDRAGFINSKNQGPIILEEIGVLRPEIQAQLLTVMESGEFYRVGDNKSQIAHNQFVGATNDEKALREDFRYRFHPFYLKPLYQRRDDVLWYIWRRDQEFFRSLYTWETLILLSYNWPGNMRELRRVIRTLKLLRKWSIRDSESDLFKYHDVRISNLNYSQQLYNTILNTNMDINKFETFLNQYNVGVIPHRLKANLAFAQIKTNEEAYNAIKNAYKGLLTFAHLFRSDPSSNIDLSAIWNLQWQNTYIQHIHYSHFNEIPKEVREPIWQFIRSTIESRLVRDTKKREEAYLSDPQAMPSPEQSVELPDIFSMTLKELKKLYLDGILKRADGVQRKAAVAAGVKEKTFSRWCRNGRIP